MTRINPVGVLRGIRLGLGPFFALPWIVAAFVGTAHGQVPQNPATASDQAVRQAESVRAQQELQKQAKDQQAKSAPAEDEPPETYPGENADLGPQKLLKQKKKKPLFDFSSDTMLTWTSNAMAQGQDEIRSQVLAETMSLAFAPEPFDIGIGKLGLRGGYRHLFYIYDTVDGSKLNSDGARLNSNNFEMSTFFLGGNLSFLEKWNASLGVDYNRIMFLPKPDKKWSYEYLGDPSNWCEEFLDLSPNWSLMRSLSISEKLSAMLVYSGAYHFTDVDSNAPGAGIRGDRVNRNDKLDNTLMASLMYSLTSKWMSQCSLRFAHSAYTQPVTPLASVHRRDQTFAPGCSLIWNPSPKVSLRVTAGGEFRRSNLEDGTAPDYRKFEASIGVSAALKF